MVNITPATTIWNTTSFMQFISNIDAASGNLLVSLVLVGAFLISVFMMKNFDTKTALLSSSGVTAVFALLLSYAGVSTVSFVLPTSVVLIICFIIYLINND